MTAVLAAAHAPVQARNAPSAQANGDADGTTGFAAALEQAQAPAKAAPRSAAKPEPKAASQDEPRPDPAGNAEAALSTEGTAGREPDTDEPSREAAAADDSRGPELALLLPGWPGAAPAVPAVPALPAGPVTPAPAGVDLDPDRGATPAIAGATLASSVATDAAGREHAAAPDTMPPQALAQAPARAALAAAARGREPASAASAPAAAGDRPRRAPAGAAAVPASADRPLPAGPSLAAAAPASAASSDRTPPMAPSAATAVVATHDRVPAPPATTATTVAPSGERHAPAAPGLVATVSEGASTATAKPGTDNALPTMLPSPGAATSPALAPAIANAAPPTVEARIAAALDSPAFAPALATQVSWLVREGVQQARLSLNPAEMGPLAVKIVLDGTQARVDFSADLAATRAVIEASLPSLAAALHDSGLTLAGGSVFDGQARQDAPGGRSDRGARQAPPAGAAAAPSGEAVAATPIRAGRGLVDLVA